MEGQTAITRDTTTRSDKLERLNAALGHREADRVPISDFFWGSFLDRWKQELRLPEETDIYDYYDLDWLVTLPNMDPHLRQFEVLSENAREIVVRTGFEAVIRKRYDLPMPQFLRFETDTVEKMEAFEFDDPWDRRRFFAAGDTQIAGVGDGFERNTPAWIETVRRNHPRIPVYGSVCEAQELGWRIIGSENMLLWIALYPRELGAFLKRVSAFVVELTRAQIQAAGGMLDGMVIFGDVAYVKGMMFSPDYWRAYFKPCVRELVEVCHAAGLPVIYHGCGNASEIFEDLIEIGVDGYNPLEAKAGLDVVELRKAYGHRLAFCGNMDVLEWARLPLDELKASVLRKLNAAKGGGFIFQSDHSVPASVSGERYDYVVRLVREYGSYPLRLGAYNLPELDAV